jgi:hypothetical protein
MLEACRGLGIPVNTRADDLFEAGATSLTVMRLIERVSAEFGEHALTPEEVIEQSSVTEIAARIVKNTEHNPLRSN